MKKRKLEKVILHMLIVLPFLIVMVYWLYQIIYSHHHDYTMSITGIYQSFSDVFGNATTGLIYAPIYYLLNDVINIGSDISSIISYYVQYCVLIELVYMIYCVMIFIPRACSSMLSKGVRSE